MNKLTQLVFRKCNQSLTCQSFELFRQSHSNANVQNPWTCVVSEAEKIVGYPTSFLNLRWLLSDEIANIAFHIRKLMSTNHPLLGVVKNLFIQNEMPSWGLIVLLVSKAGGLNKSFPSIEHDSVAGVLHSQRALSEITEIVRTSNIIHKAVQNYDAKSEKNVKDMNFGNQIALLSGDYLLSTSFHELACIKNHELNELISSALRDLVESDFLGETDIQNNPLPGKPQENLETMPISVVFGTEPMNVKNVLGNAKAEWTIRNILGGGSLLGKCCQGTLLLAGHSMEMQQQGYLFGRHIALACQAYSESDVFKKPSGDVFSLVSAPVLFHLQHDPECYTLLDKYRSDIKELDYKWLHNVVSNGPGIEMTEELQKEHAENALEILKTFPVPGATEALRNILYMLKDV